MEELRREILGISAQALVFLIGLAFTLVVGIELGARTEGTGSLLVVTLLVGAGLLGAAVLSQVIRERIVYAPRA